MKWGFLLAFVIFFATTYSFPQENSEAILKHLAKAEALQFEIKDSSIYHASIAENLALVLGDSILLGKAFNRQGAVFYVAGDYGKSIEKFTLALEIFDAIGSPEGRSFALNGLGLIHLTEDDFNEAIFLWEQCVAINRGLGDSLSVAKNLFNIGIGLSELKSHDASLRSFNSGLQALKGFESHVLHAMITNRMGKHFFDVGDYSQSLAYYSRVLDKKNTLSMWEKAFAYTGMGELYLRLDDLSKAEGYAKLGYEAAQNIGAHWDLERVTALLAEIYTNKEDLSSALLFIRENKMHSDSLYTIKKNRQISRMQLKIAQADNKKLAAENQASLQRVKLRNIALTFFTASILVLIAFIYVIYRNLKTKEVYTRQLTEKNATIAFQKDQISGQNAALREIIQTKDKLFSIISHDLRSPIHSILQTLELHQLGYFDESQKNEAMDLLYSQVAKTDRMLNDLLQWANEQNENIEPTFCAVDAYELIGELIEVYAFQADAKEIRVIHHVSAMPPIWVDKNQFRIIVQNLLHNAIKFTPKSGEVNISYGLGERVLHIHLRDSGDGMDEQALMGFSDKRVTRINSQVGTANEKGSGLGLLLVKQFVAQNRGSIQVKNVVPSGTEFSLSFERADMVPIAAN